MSKIDANSIRPGNILEHKNKLWRVAKIMHTQPGKGGAYIQVEMKDIRSGTKLNERFRSSESVDKIRLDERDYQFLYKDGDQLTLMDLESYEQINLDSDLVGDPIDFLQDNMTITVCLHESEPISVALPEQVTLVVSEAEPVVKGQTAASSYKPAVLENGVRVLVPPFISSGEKIVVRTSDRTYVERAE